MVAKYHHGSVCAPVKAPPLYHPSLLAQGTEKVKSYIVGEFKASVERVLEMASTGSLQRDMEEQIWVEVLENARLMMSSALSLQCRQVSERDIAARRLDEEHDEAYEEAA